MHEAFLDDDPNVFVIALGHLARHHGVSKIAQLSGLNLESLYKTLNADTKPAWVTVHRLLKVVKMDV
ncbi:addiction module antidote protein [Faucicola atlantae]|uniref:addiction module antidote protein n=1 Tax=Faucicola atlantae TaxID=34059 RepID=UPI001C12B246|nr:addiction module antidote protein [Moraxella atlantae]